MLAICFEEGQVDSGSGLPHVTCDHAADRILDSRRSNVGFFVSQLAPEHTPGDGFGSVPFAHSCTGHRTGYREHTHQAGVAACPGRWHDRHWIGVRRWWIDLFDATVTRSGKSNDGDKKEMDHSIVAPAISRNGAGSLRGANSDPYAIARADPDPRTVLINSAVHK